MKKFLYSLSPTERVTYGILGFAFFLFILFHIQIPFLNGPNYWQWIYHSPDAWGYILFPIAAIPFFLAQAAKNKFKNIIIPILLLILTNITLQLLNVFLLSENYSLNRIALLVKAEYSTGYFWDAFKIKSIPDLLANYPEYISNFSLHGRNKPPMLEIFNYLVVNNISPVNTAAYFIGFTILFFSVFIIPLTYLLSKEFFNDSKASWIAASIITIIPSTTLTLPFYDQIYPIFGILLIILWKRAMEQKGYLYSILFGITFSISLFITWNLTTLGAFLIIYVTYLKWKTIKTEVIPLVKKALSIIAVIILLYSILYFITGYNIIETFLSCLKNQGEMTTHLRPLHKTWFFDMYDFTLGNGYIPAVLILLILSRYLQVTKLLYALAVILCIQIGILAFGYILPAETARVWLFLQPLAIITSTYVLKDFSPKLRTIIFISHFILLLAMSQNIIVNRILN